MAGDVDAGLVATDDDEAADAREPGCRVPGVVGQRVARQPGERGICELAAGPDKCARLDLTARRLERKAVIGRRHVRDVCVIHHGDAKVRADAPEIPRVLLTGGVVHPEGERWRGLGVDSVEVGRAKPVSGERRREEGLSLRPIQKRLADLPPLEHAERQVGDACEGESRADARGAGADDESIERGSCRCHVLAQP